MGSKEKADGQENFYTCIRGRKNCHSVSEYSNIVKRGEEHEPCAAFYYIKHVYNKKRDEQHTFVGKYNIIFFS